MDNLFKFVMVLCIGAAILSVFIPANRKVDRTPISETIKETSEKDIRATRKLTNEELLQKLEREEGKGAIECWVNLYETGIEDDSDFSDEYIRLFDKAVHVSEIVHNNFKTNVEGSEYDGGGLFYEFVQAKGYVDEDWWRYGDEPKQLITQPREATVSISESGAPPRLTQEIEVYQSLPKKDYRNNRYSDDFVNKYKLDKKHIKTEADRAFEKIWNEYLRETANGLQQNVNGTLAYYRVTDRCIDLYNNMVGYSKFLSYNCMSDWIEKNKQVEFNPTCQFCPVKKPDFAKKREWLIIYITNSLSVIKSRVVDNSQKVICSPRIISGYLVVSIFLQYLCGVKNCIVNQPENEKKKT